MHHSTVVAVGDVAVGEYYLTDPAVVAVSSGAVDSAFADYLAVWMMWQIRHSWN